MYDVNDPVTPVSLAFNIINGAGGVGAHVGIGLADPLNDALYQTLTINGTIGFKDGTTPLLMNSETCCASGNRMVWAHSPGFSEFGVYYDDSFDEMYWQRANDDRFMTIDFSGRVGIGTINPSTTLHVDGTTRLDGNTTIHGSENNGSVAALRVESGSQAIIIDGNEIDTATATGLYLNNNSNNNVILANGGGRVGVGTSTPDENFHIYQNAVTSVGLLLGNSLVPNGRRGLMIDYHSSGGAEFWNFENTDMWFVTNGGANGRGLTIRANGDVCVGC